MADKPCESRALRPPRESDMTTLYLERYLNFGLSLEELRSGGPIIDIAQTGFDLSHCNHHHVVAADGVRESNREAGGIALEFRIHPIPVTGRQPNAALDRNLAYLALKRNWTALVPTYKQF